MNEVSWAESVAAWSSLATAIFTLGLLVAAVWAGCTAVSAMRASKAASDAAAEANEQMKLDSIAQARPYVYAEIVPSLAGPDAYDLRITNVGRTAARNLHIEFDNWPQEVDDVAQEVRILFETKRTLPPGCSIRTYWSLQGDDLCVSNEAVKPEEPKNPEILGMPDEGVIELFYQSDDPSAPQYWDKYEVLVFRSGLFPVSEDGPEPNNLHGKDRTFYLLGQAIARSIGNLSR